MKDKWRIWTVSGHARFMGHENATCDIVRGTNLQIIVTRFMVSHVKVGFAQKYQKKEIYDVVITRRDYNSH